MQLQPAVKNFLLALSALGAIAVFSMAQAPVTITPASTPISGTAAAPSLSVAGAPTSGLFNLSGAPAIANSGVGYVAVFADIIQMKSTTTLGWSSGVLNSSTDTALTRAGVGQFGWTAVLFANLGTPSNGAFCYCSDCTIAAPCASGGTGALAKRLNGAWVCN